MTLFIEHEEYVGALTKDIGIRMMVHSRDIMPHSEDVGLSISPGFATDIGIRQLELKRLPYPHGNCTKGKDKKYVMSDHYSYSIISCQKKCYLDELARSCNCVVTAYDDYHGIPLCNRTQRICRQKIEKKYYTNHLSCHCPPPCREIVYNTKITFSKWPEDTYLEYLKNELYQEGKYKASGNLSSYQSARDNFVNVKVYFEELNYELVEQVPANTVESVLGTTGGLLGLYIGFSLMSVVEIVILFYDLISFMCRKFLFM